MQKTIKQVLEEFLSEHREKLAKRTFKHYEDAVRYFENYMNSYGYNGLDEKDAKKFDSRPDKEVDLCKMFEPQKMDDMNFSEFLGYYYPKKIACGHDAAKKVCSAIIKLYKWLVEKGYVLLEEDGDEVELKEALSYLRESFQDGMNQWCNYNEEDYF
jgi:site-specific recombinase XerD